MNDENNNGEKKKSGTLTKIGKRVRNISRNYEEKRARSDIIFTETITPAPIEKPVTMVRGGIDIQFALLVVVLLVLGSVMSFSASCVYAEQYFSDSFHFFKLYIFYALAAIVISVLFVIYMKPLYWKYVGAASYALAVILLLLVLVIGSSGGGAQRWIQIGPVTYQPSELAKLAVIMMLALYMSHYEKEIRSVHVRGGSVRHGVVAPFLIIGIICALVMLEKHISGVIIIGLIGIAVMYLGGTRTKWIALTFGAVAVVAVLLVLVSSYAQTRVLTWWFIDKADPRESAWQILQGLYAIGSGGLFGLGLGNSRLKYGYVPEPQNDAIFTIMCEELGFFGVTLILTLIGLLVYRGFRIASRCPDKYLKLVGYGIMFKIALQTILNVAVVTNSIPYTGIALPFFSSGGTFIVMQIFEMGIVLSISRYSAGKRN